MKPIFKSLGFAALIALPARAQDMPHIRIAQGELSGFKDRGADAYLNIPFGAAPVGELRWKAPAPPPSWQGVRDASKFGPACMQQDARPQAPWSLEYFVGPPYSEDCLSLNIWTTPEKTSGKKKAVALFIPGGGFSQGGGGVPIYNGAEMAKADIVFVTMNYRQSAAGFLALPELAAESSSHASGNYTLTDILAALRWIKANIASFGGDPTKVTVMGQSAGAAAINALLQSPQSKTLFRGAIIDSGVRAGDILTSNAEREKMSADWAKSHGATTLAELRALPASVLVPVRGQSFRFGPSVDGAVIPAQGGMMIDVPVLTGWNAGEGAVGNGRVLTTPVSRAEFEKQGETLLGTGAKEILALYPSGNDATQVAQQAGHETMMMSGAGWIAARHARSPVFYYDFEHVMPGAEAAPYGSYHSSELPYVFDTLHTLKRPWTESDYRVSALLQAYWVNFIKTGDPNGGPKDGTMLPKWVPFDPARNEVMALGVTPHMRPITGKERAEALARVFVK
ncbi:MAG TPA: carboxylesterase family protein [Rhizomicrobium sp.]|nr:carboxylesterase family protein [Rhizomicrobium sp.]